MDPCLFVFVFLSDDFVLVSTGDWEGVFFVFLFVLLFLRSGGRDLLVFLWQRFFHLYFL